MSRASAVVVMAQPHLEEMNPGDAPVEPSPQLSKSAPRWIKWASLSVGAFLVAGVTAFTIPYFMLSKRVDRQLAAGAFQHTFTYFAAPEILSVGDPISDADLAALKRSESVSIGDGNSIKVNSNTPVEIQAVHGAVASIVDLSNHRRIPQTALPPMLITNMYDEGRAKRRMDHSDDLQALLVHAIVSVEDKRFFDHSGLDVLRIAKASYIDLREHRKEQGASTISMQLASNLWLDHDKSWKRKVTEAFITLHLEHK